MLSFSQTIFKGLGFTAAGMLLLLSPLLVCDVRADRAIVRVNRLNMRPVPQKTGNPIRLLNKGTNVQILKINDGWIKILHKGRPGYIINKPRYVKILKDEENKPEKETAAAQKLKKQADDVNLQIQKREENVQAIAARETEVINNLDRIDRDLNIAARKVALLKGRQKKLQEKKKATKTLFAKLLKKIKTGEAYASRRIVALYKLGRLGQIHVLASSENMHEFLKRRSALKKIIAYDRRILEELTQNRADLEKVMTDLDNQNQKLHVLEQDLAIQINLLVDSKTKRTRILKDIGRRKTLEMAAIESLKQAALELDKTISSLRHEISEKKKDSGEKGSNDFIDYKGLLKMPVKGKIISLFGSHRDKKFNVVNFQSGINISADRGEPVHAVFGGIILHAGWLKGYGNILIINHGDNYYTLYAHAEELFKAKDDTVEKDEVIATVGDTGSMAGVRLHFEVRHHGKPMDPAVWIQKG